MSTLSLQAAVRTCNVNSGEAARIESDRFLNPNNAICIPWNNMNSKGQIVCPDSFYTKRAGCNSADDRVSVENSLRPQYADYIGYNMAGLVGDIYHPSMPGSNGRGLAPTVAHSEAIAANTHEKNRSKITGTWGNQFGSTNAMICGHKSYELAMAQVAEFNRQSQSAGSAHNSYGNRNASSCGR